MTQRPNHVPKFGNWDANDHVPFTVVFDNARARKGGGGKIVNPNDPMENPAAFGLTSEPSLPPFESKEGAPPARVSGKGFQQQFSEETNPFPESQHESSKEDNPREQHAGLSARRPSGDAQGYYRPGMTGGQVRPSAADGFRRGPPGGGVKEDGGTELGGVENPVADQSPNHQAAYQGRLGNRQGAPYSAWERKVPSEGGSMSAAANAGKARPRPGSTRGDETPDRGPALPKFGAWDEKDPASGEGFTVIFNQARNEKKAGGPVRIPPLQAESPARMDYGDASKPYQPEHNYASQKKSSSNWKCCFQTSARD